MLDVTAQFIFATLLAASQFVQPYHVDPIKEAEIVQGFIVEQCQDNVRKKKKKRISKLVCSKHKGSDKYDDCFSVLRKKHKRSESESLCEETPEQYVAQWRIDAYRFRPKTPEELRSLAPGYEEAALDYSTDTSYMSMARYIRGACIRLMSSDQPAENYMSGSLTPQGVKTIVKKAKPERLEYLQSRLIEEEQSISVKDAGQFAVEACQYDHPLMGLANYGLRSAVDYYYDLYVKLPQIHGVNDLPQLPEVSFVFDKNGSLVGEISYTQVNSRGWAVRRNRRRLPEGKIPELLKKALVSIEDARFWNFKPKGDPQYVGHPGVDFAGMHRAGSATVKDSVQGASTITMQLVKNLLLYEDVFNEHFQGKRSLVRKLKEYILARRIEEALTKDQILDWYFNVIDFGRGAQGVVMAAKSYFGKTLEELNIADMAILASLPRGPNYYDPDRSPRHYERMKVRRNKVLREMHAYGHITSAQRADFSRRDLEYLPRAKNHQTYGYAQHYMNAVERQLRDWLTETNQYQHLGFDITVPIDHDMQKWAVESLQRGLLAYERDERVDSAHKLTVKSGEDQLPNIKETIDELVEARIQERVQEVQKMIEARPPVEDEIIIGEIELDPIMTEEEIAEAEAIRKEQPVVAAPSAAPIPVRKPKPPAPPEPVVLAPMQAPAPIPHIGRLKENLKQTLPMQMWPLVLDKIKNPYPDGFQFSVGVLIGKTKLGVIVDHQEDGTPVGKLFNRQPKDQGDRLKKIVDGEEAAFEEWDVVLLQKMPKSNGGFYYKIASTPKVGGGIVVLDNYTGEVLATSGGFSVGAGGRYRGAGGNKAFTEPRQPGSTVKPFTYLFALEEGISPLSSISNQTVTIPARYEGSVEVCTTYSPGGGRNEAGVYSLRSGLEKSVNKVTLNTFLAALRIPGTLSAEELRSYRPVLSEGVFNLLGLMQEFGLYKERPDVDCFPSYSIMLGGHETTVKDMAGAYAMLANGGVYNPPSTIKSIVRGGEAYSIFPETSEVEYLRRLSEVDKRRNFNLGRLRTFMQGVLARGTAQSISNWSDIIAGKTGTTNAGADAWFVGYNKRITVAVWVGYPKNNAKLYKKADGAKVALPIFTDFMKQYYEKYPDYRNDKLEQETRLGSVEMVAVELESITGYLITEQFKQDYINETGRQLNPTTNLPEGFTVREELVLPGEDIVGAEYKPKSRIIGELFWSKMTSERRDEIKYGDSYGGDVDFNSYQGYQIQFLQNAVRCANAISYNENATNGALNQTASDGIFCRYIKEQLDITRGDHGPHFNWFIGRVNACRDSDVPVKACDEVKANGLSIKEYYLHNRFGYVEE